MRGCRTPGLFRSWPGLGRGCHGWQVEHQLTQRLGCCLVHLLQPKLKAPNGHNGLASARTCALKRDGRSPGVLTSTGTPRSASSSTCSPPKSNSVVSGEGSTSKSRSLSSLSAPCRTEPNTRGLLTRNLRAASRMAWLFSWRAREGFIVVSLSKYRHRFGQTHLIKRRIEMQRTASKRMPVPSRAGGAGGSS